MKGPYTKNLLIAISEGILGYLLYQSHCGVSEAYSEYLLYDPVVRIAKDKKWIVRCEFPLPKNNSKNDKSGDFKRIDFLFKTDSKSTISATEIKVIKENNASINFKRDISKLKIVPSIFPTSKCRLFLIIIGNHSENNIEKLNKILKNSSNKLNFFYLCTFTNHFKRVYGVTVLEVIR